MKNKYDCWLYIESFVHISTKLKYKSLLYNPYNGMVLENNNPAVFKILEKIKSNENLYVFKISRNELGKKEIKNFVSKLRNNFMGDVILAPSENGKPFQMKPIPKVFANIDDKETINNTILRNLMEITFYINNVCEHDCSICENAYKQFLFCRKGDSPEELEIKLLKLILEEVKFSGIIKFSIIGGNLFSYSAIDEFNHLCLTSGCKIEYYINFRHMISLGSVSRFKGLANKNSTLRILVNFPVIETNLIRLIIFLNKFEIRKIFEFIIEDEEQFIFSKRIISRSRLDNFVFRPYFNQRNKTFFNKNVFLKKKDIISAKPTQEEILSRTIINKNFFGKLIFLSNGDVFTNINKKPIGNIYRDSLRTLVSEEIFNRHYWKITREKIDPCNRCVYENLCPPISNYEFFLVKYNLCNMKIC